MRERKSLSNGSIEWVNRRGKGLTHENGSIEGFQFKGYDRKGKGYDRRKRGLH